MGATDYVFKTRLYGFFRSPGDRREAGERAERKKAEEALRESEASLREQAKLLSLTHDAIFVRDPRNDKVLEPGRRRATAGRSTKRLARWRTSCLRRRPGAL